MANLEHVSEHMHPSVVVASWMGRRNLIDFKGVLNEYKIWVTGGY